MSNITSFFKIVSIIFALALCGEAEEKTTPTTLPSTLPISQSVTSQPLKMPVVFDVVSNISDFARFVPIWAAAYVEMHELSDFVDSIQAQTSNDLQDGSKLDISQANRRFGRMIRGVFGLESEEFVHDLLGHRAAMAWGGTNMADQFGLIVEPEDTGVIKRFLSAVKAEEVPGHPDDRIRRYTLSVGYLRAATIDGKLIVATVGSAGDTGMYYAMLDLVGGTSNQSLAAVPMFVDACSQMTPDYQVMFIVLPRQGDKHLALGKEGIAIQQGLAQFAYLAGAAKAESSRLKVALVVNPLKLTPSLVPTQALAFDEIKNTLIFHDDIGLSYRTIIDPDQWYKGVLALADQGDTVARKYLAVMQILVPDEESRRELIEAIGPEAMVLVRVADSSAKDPATTTKPKALSTSAVALAVDLKDPDVVQSLIRRMTGMLDAISGIYHSDDEGIGGYVPTQFEYRGVTIHRTPVKLSDGLQQWQSLVPITSAREIVWAVTDRQFLIATDYKWMTELLDEYLSEVGRVQDSSADEEKSLPRYLSLRINLPLLASSFECDGAGGDATADLRSVGRRSKIVLGIAKRQLRDAETGKTSVVVAAVLPGYPAWNKLLQGDQILAVEHTPLNPENADKTLLELLDKHGTQDQLSVSVLRDGIVKEVVLDLRKKKASTVRTIELIRRAVRLAARRYKDFDLACRYLPNGEVSFEVVFQGEASR